MAKIDASPRVTATFLPRIMLLAALFILPAPDVREARGDEKPEEMEAWKTAEERIIEDLQRTVRRRDQLAFQKQLAALVEKGAEPKGAFRQELGRLLTMAPPGIVLGAVVRKLVDDGSPAAVSLLFDALTRPAFQDVSGRDLGEKDSEGRRRLIEFYLLQLGDRVQAAREAEPPPKMLPVRVNQELEEKLIGELASGNERRSRCAAYLLGGTGRKAAGPALAGAAAQFEASPFTQAILLEALGRTDPEAGAAALESAAGSQNEMARLVAVPVLGHIKTKGAEGLIKDASEAKSWYLRRAAVEACRNRRDLFAMDILMARYPKETSRLQFDILEAVRDITKGAVPPDPKEWAKWWPRARPGFQPAPRGKPAPAPAKGRTSVMSQPLYFGIEVWSSQLAILCDVSGSMNSSNLNLGTSGVQVAGAMKEGAPIALARDQIQRLLKTLPPRALFNIIVYNQNVKAFKDGLLPASKANVQAAVKFVDGLTAEGGTNIHDSLIKALKDASVDTIYLLSDGEPTDGARTEPDDILEAVQMLNRFRKTRIHTIQLGDDQQLMKDLAAFSGGSYKLLEVSATDEKAAKKDARGAK